MTLKTFGGIINTIRYLIILFLFLIGCSKNEHECPDMSEQLKRNSVIDCHFGILYSMDAFKKQLVNKVTKKQIDDLWNRCGKLK